MRVAIVGLGLIGVERAKSILALAQLEPHIELVGVYDTNEKSIEKFRNEYPGVSVAGKMEDLILEAPNWVFVATPHDVAYEISVLLLSRKIGVVLEKPMGRNLSEAGKLASLAEKNRVKLRVGLNYRHYRGVENLIQDVREKKFGSIISVKMTLGHGNSPGMEKSWKLDKERCGGGCLIDPGIHLLDLVDVISGGAVEVHSVQSWMGFWKTGIEEEAHILLSSQNSTLFNIDISLNRWRSRFCIEVNGTDGYGVVEGRGGSYGRQTYRTGKRWGWLEGKNQRESELTRIDYDASDSFFRETAAILGEDLIGSPINTIYESEAVAHEEALRAMSLLDRCVKKMEIRGVSM